MVSTKSFAQCCLGEFVLCRECAAKWRVASAGWFSIWRWHAYRETVIGWVDQ